MLSIQSEDYISSMATLGFIMPKALDYKKSIKTNRQMVNIECCGVVRYVLSFMICVSCNTLPFLVSHAQTTLFAAIDIISIGVILSICRKFSVDRYAITKWCQWLIIVIATDAIVFFATGDSYGKYGACFIVFLGICPMMLYLLDEANLLQKYMTSFTNTVSILAVISLILWLVGPVLNLILPNCTIANKWNGLGMEMNIPSQGYFYLQYVTQTTNVSGFEIVRNTGLFAEAPMFSFVLSTALITECFLSNKTRIGIALLLSLCIATTFSTTGIILVMVVIILECGNWFTHTRSRWRWIVLIGILIGIIAAVTTASWLINAKMSSSSGSTRADDFRAGYLAWKDSPITGYGLGDYQTVRRYMSTFRLMNVGFSNSPFDVLVRGGIVFMAPFAIAIVGFLRYRGRQLLALLLFLYLWILTIVTFQPLTFCFFSLGVVGYMKTPSYHGINEHLYLARRLI